MSVLPPDYQVNEVAVRTHLAISSILNKQGISNFKLSPLRCKQTAFYFLRDIYRIDDQQEGQISLTKFAGYWAFWVRKIKPILFAYTSSEEGDEQALDGEISDVNEQVALELALAFLVHEGKGQAEEALHDDVRFQCQRACDGKKCVLRYVEAFFGFKDHAHQRYIVYSMLHRTFGPHHVTMMLDQLIFSSCAHPDRHTP